MTMTVLPGAKAQNTNVPEDFKWRTRLLLIFTPSVDNLAFQRQYAQLKSDQTGLSERDLRLFWVLPDKITDEEGYEFSSTSDLHQRYQIAKNKFAILLIGKDGSVKLRVYEDLLAQQELYKIIDAMPMRQQEIQRKNNR